MIKRTMSRLALLGPVAMLLASCGTDAATSTPVVVPATAVTTAATATAVITTAATATTGTTAATATTGTTAATATTGTTAATATTGTTAATATTGTTAATTGGKLQVIWFAWQPCQALTDLSKTFPGGEVDVRCVPIGQWHDQIFTDFAAKGGADIVILDSQFIGEAVKGGHIAELTDWMKTNIDVADYVPAALAAYGEYPAGSKRYYGVPAEGDTQMYVYRKDLFAKADVRAAYKAKTAKDLGPPSTWSELLGIAQFFKDSAGKYGVQNGYTTHWCGTPACYDQIATHWNQILWSFGGDIWDPAAYKTQGFINSDTAVKALDFDRQLFQTGPAGQGNFQFNETVDALCSGTTATGTIWFGFGAAFVNTKIARTPTIWPTVPRRAKKST